jgi:methionyl-tRNA formyltransferase
MVAKPDAGRIVDQQAVPIGDDDPAVDVFRKVTGAAETVLKRSLPRLLDGSAQLRAQDLASGSYFGGRKPEDGRIDWTKPAREVHNLVRAVAPPYPGAFTDLPGGRVLVLRTRRLGRDAGAAATAHGRSGPALVAAANAPHVTAVCGDGEALALVELALDGHPLTVREFVARFGTGPIHIS